MLALSLTSVGEAGNPRMGTSITTVIDFQAVQNFSRMSFDLISVETKACKRQLRRDSLRFPLRQGICPTRFCLQQLASLGPQCRHCG